MKIDDEVKVVCKEPKIKTFLIKMLWIFIDLGLVVLYFVILTALIVLALSPSPKDTSDLNPVSVKVNKIKD
jgi:hypothetical protein